MNIQQLYAMIGQLTVENQLLRAKLAERAIAETNEAVTEPSKSPRAKQAGLPAKPNGADAQPAI